MPKKKTDELQPNEYSISIAKNVEAVEEFRSTWEQWQWHPNSDIDFYLTIIDSRSEILRPHVILINRKGSPVAMLVGRIEDHYLEIKFGYKTILRPKLRILRIVYGGLLGDQSKPIADIFIREIFKEIKQRNIEAIHFENLRVDSVMYRLSRANFGVLCGHDSRKKNVHWKMVMPDEINTFYKKLKSKHRYWLRRMPRLLEKDYPGKVKLRTFQNREDVLLLCNDVEKIAKKTYQRGIGSGFVNNLENQRRMALEADRGWLRAYILYINDRPCAFWIGELYRRRFYLAFTGYDPVFKKYELGTIVFTKMLDDLCTLTGNVREMDFGFGDAFYKQRFGDCKWEEASITIFAPTFKGLGINLLSNLNFIMSLSVEFLLNKTKLTDRIKKKWRNRSLKYRSHDG
jgi:hypothetical protein